MGSLKVCMYTPVHCLEAVKIAGYFGKSRSTEYDKTLELVIWKSMGVPGDTIIKLHIGH